MKTYIKLSNVLRISLVLIIGLTTFISVKSSSKADELSDLSSQIQQKQKEKDQTLANIKSIEKNITNILSAKGDLSSQLSQLNTQKTILDAQFIDLEAQIVSQEASLKDYSGRLDKKNADIQEKMNYVYKLSYLQPDMMFASEKSAKEYFNDVALSNAAIELFRNEIKDFQDKINTVTSAKIGIENDKKNIIDSKASVTTQIQSVQTALNTQNKALADANKTKGTFVAQSNALNSQLQGLSAKQKQLLDAEITKMNASKQTNQTPIAEGQYYFLGRGRDLIEGHGIGMSQWGAYGMAYQGWSYDRILTFYYTGVTIGDYTEPTEVRVSGKEGSYPPDAKLRGYLTIDEYLSGIGEVPNSWPTEAVKAQVVAARTYVMGVCGGSTACQICGTASCQVYNGVTTSDPSGMGKSAFVQQTKGKVILYDNKPIVAYYSASHRGYSTSVSSAWSCGDTNSIPPLTSTACDKPYLKPVNDDAYAAKDYQSANPYYVQGCNCPSSIKTYNWQWRTNGYSLDQLTEIFSKSTSLNVGKVIRIDIKKDISNRASRVTLVGQSGTKTLTGWDFRAIFNAVTPFNDYVYSTEFAFYQK